MEPETPHCAREERKHEHWYGNLVMQILCSPISRNAKSVLISVCAVVDWSTWRGIAPTSRVAARASMSEATVSRTVGELEALGVLKRKQRRWQSPVWSVNPAVIGGLRRGVPADEGGSSLDALELERRAEPKQDSFWDGAGASRRPERRPSTPRPAQAGAGAARLRRSAPGKMAAGTTAAGTTEAGTTEAGTTPKSEPVEPHGASASSPDRVHLCLLYTSDAADE